MWWPLRPKEEPADCASMCKELRFLKAEVNVLHGRIKLLETMVMKREKRMRDDWK